jgi:hypothetical protein
LIPIAMLLNSRSPIALSIFLCTSVHPCECTCDHDFYYIYASFSCLDSYGRVIYLRDAPVYARMNESTHIFIPDRA